MAPFNFQHSSIMSSLNVLLSGIFIYLVGRLAYGRLRRRFIDKLPGPPSSSWLTGMSTTLAVLYTMHLYKVICLTCFVRRRLAMRLLNGRKHMELWSRYMRNSTYVIVSCSFQTDDPGPNIVAQNFIYI